MIHPDPNHVYVIAEAGVNHNGDKDMALRLIDEAARAGADAVKFQTFKAARLSGRSAPKAAYQKAGTDGAESQLEMLTRLELPQDWHMELRDHAMGQGVDFISTAFDTESLVFLTELGVPFFKIPSGELTNAPLLWQFAKIGKPLVVSTGMATLSEIEAGLAVITHALGSGAEPDSMDEVWQCWSDPARRGALDGHVSLLHCTSQYPTPFAEANLRAMDRMRAAFGLPVGYSDHTEGTLIPLVAVARDARIIEKHYTLDRSLPGPDHAASLEPDELVQMMRDIRRIEAAFGDGCKVPQISEWDTRLAARQQVAAAHDIATGAILSRADMTTARLGAGLPPQDIWRLIGTPARRDFAAGEAIEG